jgi:hypothetical protein
MFGWRIGQGIPLHISMVWALNTWLNDMVNVWISCTLELNKIGDGRDMQ